MSWLFDVFPVFVSIARANVVNVLPAAPHKFNLFINSSLAFETQFLFWCVKRKKAKNRRISIRMVPNFWNRAINEPDYSNVWGESTRIISLTHSQVCKKKKQTATVQSRSQNRQFERRKMSNHTMGIRMISLVLKKTNQQISVKKKAKQKMSFKKISILSPYYCCCRNNNNNINKVLSLFFLLNVNIYI